MNHVDEIKSFYAARPENEVPMEDFISEIRDRQKSMGPGVAIEDAGLTAYTAPAGLSLSPGCRACKAGTWLCVVVGYRCDAMCRTCPQVSTVARREEPGSFAGIRAEDLHVYSELFGTPRPLPAVGESPLITGIAYTGGEPFLYLDKVAESAAEITRRAPKVYQWAYTNGMAATATSMKRLADAGIRELRFNLLASGFSEAVMSKLPVASDIFERICVEIPAVDPSREFLLERDGLERICEAGATQLNLAELYILTPNAIAEYGTLPLYTYQSFFYGPVRSPAESRRITCSVMEASLGKNLPLVINDCSNDTKHLQIVKKSLNPFLRQVKLG